MKKYIGASHPRLALIAETESFPDLLPPPPPDETSMKIIGLALGREGVAVFRTFSNQSMAPEWPLHTGDPARIPAVCDVDGRNPGLKTLPVMDRWLLAYRQMVMLMNGNYRRLRKYSDC